MAPGPLIIVSGPAGAGKSSLIAALLADAPWPLRLSISVTTRQPRPGERDGVAYRFWTREAFEAELKRGGFLEWADVFGNYYGTLRQEVEPQRAQGTGVLLEIDVQGCEQVKKLHPEALSIFIRTSSLETYEERLRRRGADSEASIRRRVAGARVELARAVHYDYHVINDDFEQALTELRRIVGSAFAGVSRPE
ncbi:MAG: guanylate kinase [Gemmataceae bacterium]